MRLIVGVRGADGVSRTASRSDRIDQVIRVCRIEDEIAIQLGPYVRRQHLPPVGHALRHRQLQPFVTLGAVAVGVEERVFTEVILINVVERYLAVVAGVAEVVRTEVLELRGRIRAGRDADVDVDRLVVEPALNPRRRKRHVRHQLALEA